MEQTGLHIDLYKRVDTLEDTMKDLRQELSGLNSAVSSLLTKIEIFGGQLMRATDKPPPWAAASVIIVLVTLILAPTLWLATKNFEEISRMNGELVEARERLAAQETHNELTREIQRSIEQRLWFQERSP